ncbi:related to Nucleolar protein 9 [Cephalotrichum gorgonifer]|uniref:Nucleolar protein 9 n=1 Tax=Cephalotrichum gorgonifer TaxID=2041049 RepID=A0AAE8MVV1_9PEZI|nr:related to Nucleolar protein 9 [Cephalotrichum gorgonifer]
MPKPRTKRKDVREERKRKHEDEAAQDEAALGEEEQRAAKKRQRLEAMAEQPDSEYYFDAPQKSGAEAAGEPQFFGMLTDEEQEYFRGTAEVLELNDWASPEDRAYFIENVFAEAKGKELKLACSQGCSRLMEKLILLSNVRQKKLLFEAFAGNFLALVQHRFASHCCEMLFLQAAPAVGQDYADVAGEEEEKKEGGEEEAGGKKGSGEEEEKPETPMEDLFLLTLDELEADMSFLLTQTYASHTLRALLLVLSGKPLEDATTAALLKSKRKERISVPGAGPAHDEEQLNQQPRVVPESFGMAIQKIISDIITALDSSGLRIMVSHPTGNPILQILLELDITYNAKAKKSKAESVGSDTLLGRLLPGAPESLKEDVSKASEFINSMIYDPIGSRLLETLITHAPGKIFKAIYQNCFAKRLQSYVRNEVASYACIKLLNRLSKEDLVASVDEILPSIPTLVEKARYNVIRVLLERCSVRGATDEAEKIAQALVQACGGRPEDLVPALCGLRAEEDKASKDKNSFQKPARNTQAMVSHGAKLISTMLSIPACATVAQTSLLSLTPDELVRLATGSTPTMAVLKASLANPSSNAFFHKRLVASLAPHIVDLAASQAGHNLVNELIAVPTKGKERSVPFHVKETMMAKLAQSEPVLRESWMGRSVWRTWKGDVWKRGRADWGTWAKEAEGRVEGAAFAAAPAKKARAENAVVTNPHIARRFARQAERAKERRLRFGDAGRPEQVGAIAEARTDGKVEGALEQSGESAVVENGERKELEDKMDGIELNGDKARDVKEERKEKKQKDKTKNPDETPEERKERKRLKKEKKEKKRREAEVEA